MCKKIKNNVNILIVEDEGLVAMDLQSSLENFGYSISCIVDSAEEAIQKTEELNPDLVLMDIMLKGEMDGIEAAGQIRARFGIPVIYLTAYADENLLERAKKTGSFGYIVKPFEEKDLHTSIQIALDQHKMENELHQAKEEAQLLKKEAEDANMLKDKFISLVAHDLKSPFTTILGFINLIMDDTDPPLTAKHREMMAHVVDQGYRLVDMIQELLDISRFKTGKIRPKPTFFDARFTGMSIIANYQHDAEKKGIKLACDIPEHTRLKADTHLFSEVIKNLVSNAIKFCSEGDTVSLCLPPGQKSVVAVKDTGSGIPGNRQEDLFKYEVQTSTPGTAGERGTGLGLPLSLDIMKAHGGTLELESTPGKGSVFYARLPYTRPVILLVDDTRLIRLALRKILQPLDVKTMEAQNGKEALDILAKSDIHLVITDINMPVMDGLELLKNIRKNLSMENMPVIVLTSDEQEKTKEEVFRLQANDFVNKPINTHDFIPRVRRYIG